MTSKCCILHGHSSGSNYDGLGKPKDRALYAKQLGMDALALTDHGNMYLSMDHYFSCREIGIKPILGIEAYHQPEFLPEKTAKRYHLSLLAKNFEGYRNLCTLTSRSNIETFYSKPIMTFEQLYEHNRGIICLSGCVLGLLSQTILQGAYDDACGYAETFIKIFGDRFYFEVQPQEFDDQKRANEGILRLAEKFNCPVVMTSDSHFIAPDDLDTYILFRKMNYTPPKKKRNESNENISQETDDMFSVEAEQWEDDIRRQYGKLYMPTGEELADRWQAFMGTDGHEYVLESQRIADRVDVYEIKFSEQIPKAYAERSEDEKEIEPKVLLAEKVKEGLKRLGVWEKTATRKKEDGTIEVYRPYVERVRDELEIIVQKKYERYFLLVADMIHHAREIGVAVGPGRGSGGGSMVAAAIGITEIDPVKNYCMFARFLQPHRATLPDFDTDFGPKIRRYEVFEYMKHKYAGKVALICNVNKLTRDQLLNDLAKVLHIPDDVRDAMKVVIGKKGIGSKDKEKLPVYDELMQDARLKTVDETYHQIVKHFCKLYGNVRNLSVHASGLAIASDDLGSCVPLFVRGKEKEIYTSYDKTMLEKIGVVKIDILGVDEIGALQKMCQLAHVDYHAIPLDDKMTYDSFVHLNTMGVFQINESPGAVAYVRAIRPRNIEELCACIAMNRPGSSNLKFDDTKQLDVYVQGKKGQLQQTLLSEYCKDTYGALVYQEQIMEICRQVADMSWASASKVMKGLHGQLKRDDPLAVEFIQGAAKKSGMSEDDAWKLFHTFTAYTFNKAHSLAYATVGYWMMYMKVHYPFEFFLAAFQFAAKEYEERAYIRDALKNKVMVLPAHVNKSMSNYSTASIDGKKVLVVGLSSVKGVGPAAIGPIVRERQKNGFFLNEEDLLRRVNGCTEKGEIKKLPIKSDTMTALRASGAVLFDDDAYKEKCIQFLREIKYGKEKENS